MNQPLLDGRYRILNELGRGGMATVYRGVDMTSGLEVAIKILLGALSPNRRERFLREGQVLGALRHPGIVAIHNAGNYQGRPYLVMQLVHGARELSEAWKGHGIDTRVEWLREVAEALGAAHKAGIVHRDVKPSNVLIDQEGKARLTDFGVAVADDQERLTRTGQLVGTPHWMAPELFRGGDSSSPASDVWSLGVLLYEALTDRLPFEGDTIHQLVGNLAQGYVTPRTLSREIPRDLETVCICALSPNPAKRYRNGKAFADDLGRFLRNEPVQARRGWRRVKASTVAFLALSVLGLVTAGTVTYGLTRSAPDMSSEETEREPSDASSALRMNPVVAFGASAVLGDEVPTLEALQPWAIEAGDRGVRFRYNGQTSPELRLPCRYDGATPFALRARLRVPLLLPSNRACVAFQRWERDAEPIEPEVEEWRIDDYLLGADNVEREAIFVELVCVEDGSFFGSYQLRAGTQSEVQWTAELPRPLGPDRELEFTLRFVPKTGVQIEVLIDERRVEGGEFPLGSQPKGEWLVRVGGNLTYTPTTRFGVWRADGNAEAGARLELLGLELEAAGSDGVVVREEPGDDPRHELGRLGRDTLRAEPDFDNLEERCKAIGEMKGDFDREEQWIANTARYLKNLSLGRRGDEQAANREWHGDLTSYHIQGADVRKGRLSWLGWRWAHDMACYDPLTRRAIARSYLRVWQIESGASYLRGLITPNARNTWEGQGIQRYPEKAEFGVRRWAIALALSGLRDVRAVGPLKSELAFLVGAYEEVDGLVSQADFGQMPPSEAVGIRLGRAVAAVASGDLALAQAEIDAVDAEAMTPQLRAARDWVQGLSKPEVR